MDDHWYGQRPDNSVVERDLDLTVDVSPTNSKIDLNKISNLDLGLSFGHFNLSNQDSVLTHSEGPVVGEESKSAGIFASGDPSFKYFVVMMKLNGGKEISLMIDSEASLSIIK